MENLQFSISNEPLSNEEKKCFSRHLMHLKLDENIWDIYDQFLNSASDFSRPQIIRGYQNGQLALSVFVIKCYDHGKTLFKSPILYNFIKQLHFPIYLWMKAGIGPECFSNPGFLCYPEHQDKILPYLINYIKKNFYFFFIHDTMENKINYPDSTTIEYPDEGLVVLENKNNINEFINDHKNIKKKIKVYSKKGGRVEVIKGLLDEQTRSKIADSVKSTGEKSIFKLPYQENYPNMCMQSAGIKNDKIIHFICRSDTDFLGYHSFIEFKDHLRCLNGAFNRNLTKTYHAYENMILKVVEYAFQNQIKTIYFGPVLNETKRRMMNQFIPTQLYIYSSNLMIQKLMSYFLSKTQLQNKQLLQLK